jgi:hypothetical protein
MFALLSLCGIGDTYTFGNNHNVKLYVRPEDRKVLALPWDWDFAFVQSATGPLYGDQNLSKIIARPPFLHLYYGHLLDLLDTVYDSTYMSRWIAHYGTMAGENYSTFVSYISTRSASVRSRLPAKLTFAVTTNGGNDFTVAAGTADIEGDGWIDVAGIALADREELPQLTWTTATHWRATVRLDPGANALSFLAYDLHGDLLGIDSLTVTSTFVPPAPGIAAIVPGEGQPGTQVEIQGTDFLPTMEVFFGATKATGVSVLASSRLSAEVPALAPGVYPVTVRNSVGGASGAVDFRVVGALEGFIRGDANLDGIVDLSDAVRILFYLFVSGELSCADAADSNDDESLDVSDALFILRFLFQRGAAPSAPFPSPGLDPDVGGQLDCAAGLFQG